MTTSTDSRSDSTAVAPSDPGEALGTVASIPVGPPPAGSAPSLTPSPPPPASASTTPVVINGGAPTGVAPTITPAVDSYGVSTETTQLFREGDVTISRQRTMQGGTQQLNQLVIDTGNGDDDVQITQRSGGGLDVSINGKPFEITLAAGQELAVRTADGNDIVHAAPDVRVNMTVEGGAGDDTIVTGAGQDRVTGGDGNDTIATGNGKDYVFGGSGDDRIASGADDDTVYGGDGADRILGGDGRDFVNGGRGNDTLDGGRGNDILSGGADSDTVRGGEGNDRVFVGPGGDTVHNQAGSDTIYGPQATNTLTADAGASNTPRDVAYDPNLGSSIVIDGSDEFKQRVQADLELLRSSPSGRQMLAELDAADARGNTVTIRDTYGVRANAVQGPVTDDAYLRPDGTPGAGQDVVVRYSPSHHVFSGPDRPPVVGLYHELAHAYNLVNGTGQRGSYHNPGDTDHGVLNLDRQALGVDATGVLHDFDRNPATPATRTNPAAFSEKDLRAEMDLDRRDTYRNPVATPTATPPAGGTGPTTTPETPATTAPATTGGTLPALDPHLERMLAAMQAGDNGALRAASRDLSGSAFGQAFREEGAAAVKDQQAVQARQEQATTPEPEASASLGARSR